MIDSDTLIGLVSIIGIDLVLAGDNAVVIALAARNLPRRLQRRAVLYGAMAAVVLRVVLTASVVWLLGIPLLKLVGGLILLRIAWKLAVEDQEETEEDIESASSMRGAIYTILMADVVMSLDNVLAVAAAARGEIWLIVFGLIVSIPIVMGGASLLLGIIRRHPWIVWAGALLIAFTAFELIISDPAVHAQLHGFWAQEWLHRVFSLGAGSLLIAAAWMNVRKYRQTQTASNSSLML